MPREHRASIAVVIVLRVVESNGEQWSCRNLTAQIAFVLSRKRTAIKVSREVS